MNGVELAVTEAGDPTAPPVILAHGFPEGAYSWRHQLAPLAEAGYHAIAPDQRGYGHSSCPPDVSAYGIDALCGDLLGLLEETGHDQGVFVGHDWGALIVWDLARLHPERVRAVVGVSVPFTKWPMPPTELMRARFGDRFFYIIYFQPVGPAEEELGRDPRTTMAKMLYWASGEGWPGLPDSLRPAAGTRLLDTMGDVPELLPGWLSWTDVDAYAEHFRASGFFGPVSYYRNLDANYERVKDFPVARVSMPAFFIGGEHDLVTQSNPGAIDAMRALLPDLRGVVVLPGVGHWTQQEDPDGFDNALLGFLRSL